MWLWLPWMLGPALPTTTALLIAAIVAWPHRRVRHHRISNYFFLRRLRAQNRRRTPGGATKTGDAADPQRALPGRAGVEPYLALAAPPAPRIPGGHRPSRTGVCPPALNLGGRRPGHPPDPCARRATKATP